MRVTVPQLVRYHGERQSVFQAQNRVSMTPIVESSTGEIQGPGRRPMDAECPEFVGRENPRTSRHRLDVGDENIPSPILGRPHDPISPSGFTSSRVNGSLLNVNVTSREPLNPLPLHPVWQADVDSVVIGTSRTERHRAEILVKRYAVRYSPSGKRIKTLKLTLCSGRDSDPHSDFSDKDFKRVAGHKPFNKLRAFRSKRPAVYGHERASKSSVAATSAATWDGGDAA